MLTDRGTIYIESGIAIRSMSASSNRQCQYKYEPPEPLAPDDRISLSRPSHVQCPHETVDADSQRCLFHSGDPEYPRREFTDQFLEALQDDAIPPNFAAGQLEGLDLSGQTLAPASGSPIDLRGAVIDGDLDLTGATVKVPLLLDQAAITGDFYADNAVFAAPVGLIETNINGQMHWHNATIDGGLPAHGFNGGYVDARDLVIDGPLLFDGASFSSNLLLSRAEIAGPVDLSDTSFNWSLDATLLVVQGDFSLVDSSIGADCDLVGADITGGADLRKLSVTEETDWSHATIGGDIAATDTSFDETAIFDDLNVQGNSIQFDNANFGGKADFATQTLAVETISFSNATFTDEVWFTHSHVEGAVQFDGATFHGMSHLRDATFDSDLSLRDIETTGQFFLHGSTIAGEFDCTDATFEHFQFSATTEQTADFSRAEFIEKAIFKSSTFGDRVWFDDASFAGHPDFTDTRFTGKTTFDGTEFLVDPTFEGTRFAVEPELNAAEFPIDSMAIAERREQMILAHPESLSHTGETLPITALSDDVAVPAEAASLLESNLELTKRIAAALTKPDQRSWHKLVEAPIRTARTAVAQLEDTDDNAVLVFGLHLNAEATTLEELLEKITVAGVYCQADTEIRFGHLDSAVVDADYLLAIPGADDAFESGAAVATASELQTAAVRNEKLRAALLGKQADTNPIKQRMLPVLAGITEL